LGIEKNGDLFWERPGPRKGCSTVRGTMDEGFVFQFILTERLVERSKYRYLFIKYSLLKSNGYYSSEETAAAIYQSTRRNIAEDFESYVYSKNCK
jgi:hypothetical protein